MSIELNTTTIAAIMAWVRAGTGLVAIWSQQDGPPVARPFIEISRPTVEPLRGMAWVDVEDNPTPSAGAEILHIARVPVVISLRLQCFASDPIEDDGTAAATAILTTLARKAALPSMQAALRAAGLGLLGFGTVQSTSGVVDSVNVEPRSTLDVRLHGASEVSESGTFIETADIAGTAAI